MDQIHFCNVLFLGVLWKVSRGITKEKTENSFTLFRVYFYSWLMNKENYDK